MYLLNFLQALQSLASSLQNAIVSLETAKSSFYYVSNQPKYQEIVSSLSLEDLEGLSELLNRVQNKISQLQQFEVYNKEKERYYF